AGEEADGRAPGPDRRRGHPRAGHERVDGCRDRQRHRVRGPGDLARRRAHGARVAGLMGTASFEGAGVRVVVASDKFKGTLTSAEVAAAVGAGVRRVCPDATVVSVPVADGGDGTLAAAVAAGYTLVPVVASGPTGEPVSSGYARLGDTA